MKRIFSSSSVNRKRAAWKPIAIASIGAAALITTGASVYATLQATASNVTPQEISSGTLSLILSDNGTGFSQNVSNIAPGDTVNRFVLLDNDGSLDAQTLTFTATATGSTNLITDGTSPSTTQALRVAVTRCSVAWTAATGVCSGTTSSLLVPTVLSSVATPQVLLAGSIASEELLHLRIQLLLPDQNETTVNGVPPAETVQGASVDVAYSFNVLQRTATTTNS